MHGHGGHVAETSGGLVKMSIQVTPDQADWLESESARLGLGSVAAVARFYVQAAMSVSSDVCRACPIHCRRKEAQP